jgi:alpha-glucuronidase
MKPGYDRAGAAFDNLQPFDGKFAANVLLQVKNGPVDFQPREPFHPIFGGMPKTQLMPEFQITQEYLGQANHLVFLAPMWREVLEADTYAKGRGSTVTKVADGSLDKHTLTGMPAGQYRRLATGPDTISYRPIGMPLGAWPEPDLSSSQIADDGSRYVQP